jgi:hypothetical protein
MKESTKISTIKINCNDNTTRRITCIGAYNESAAKNLAIDLEGKNFKSVEITIQ